MKKIYKILLQIIEISMRDILLNGKIQYHKNIMLPEYACVHMYTCMCYIYIYIYAYVCINTYFIYTYICYIYTYECDFKISGNSNQIPKYVFNWEAGHKMYVKKESRTTKKILKDKSWFTMKTCHN